MRWPRGKYNGERIIGFNVSLSLKLPEDWDIARWLLIPRVSWNFGNPYFIWLIFTLRAEARYTHGEALIR